MAYKKVFYHANCTDGAASALAAFIAMGDGADYIPVQYGNSAPQINDGDLVYIVDFSFSEKILLELADKASYVCVLDHHKTAKADLEHVEHPNLHILFDMNQSGAVLTWKFFHASRPVPILLQHIQDRDLWRFDMPGSKEIHRAINIDKDWKNWARYLYNVQPLIQDGAAILKYLDAQIGVIIKNEPIVFDITGDTVPVYNLPGFLISDALNAALEAYPECPYAVGFMVLPDKTIYSLRSRSGSDVDISEIAKKHGGGGHKHAAGFNVLHKK